MIVFIKRSGESKSCEPGQIWAWLDIRSIRSWMISRLGPESGNKSAKQLHTRQRSMWLASCRQLTLRCDPAKSIRQYDTSTIGTYHYLYSNRFHWRVLGCGLIHFNSLAFYVWGKFGTAFGLGSCSTAAETFSSVKAADPSRKRWSSSARLWMMEKGEATKIGGSKLQINH